MNYNIFLIIGLAITINSCSNTTGEHSPSKEKPGDFFITAELGSLWKADSTFYSIGAPPLSTVMDIRVVFNNETSDTVKFQSMSCSFPDEFLISDTLNFGILPSVCFANVPVTVSIPPHHKSDRLIRVFWNNRQQNSDDKFEIGRKKQELSKSDEILWSNPIVMSRLYNEVYK